MKTIEELRASRAGQFAAYAHGLKDQRRKYTNEPYIEHPLAVAHIVSRVTSDQDVIDAALLHDVVEDTAVTLDEIESAFGSRATLLVRQLTDIAQPTDGNRAVRVAINRAHIAAGSVDAHTIKLADVIHNTHDTVQHDPKFAKTYMAEKKLLLDVLNHGSPHLKLVAWAQVNAYYAAIEAVDLLATVFVPAPKEAA